MMVDKRTREAVTESRIAIVLMRLNEAKRRQITMGHMATHGDLEAAMDLISDMAAKLLSEWPAQPSQYKPWSGEAASYAPHWSPLDTEVRD